MWTDQTPRAEAVENGSSSPAFVPRGTGATIPVYAVVPDIHTPYDFYERNYLNA
jgi:hypothetical protein